MTGNLRRLGVLVVIVAVSGCGKTPAPPPVDASRGRIVLREALDAWKDGKTSDSLMNLSPPIRVADEDWLGGLKLESYEIGATDQLIGGVLRCPVTLTIKNAKGKPVKKVVAFNVTTAPSPSVIRQD